MMSSDPGQDQPIDPMRNFTDAVKTIVNVPKEAVNSKPGTRKLDDKYEEWKCPDCGNTYVRSTQHKHEG